jgi:hypothetical protein
VIYSDFTRWTRFGAVSEAATFADARNDTSRVPRRGAGEARVTLVEWQALETWVLAKTRAPGVGLERGRWM